MKLLYTDIQYDMTDILVNEAREQAEAGRRVFYLAPNSLSFEKERAVLERLPEGASFAITVTRFAQMARYFILNHAPQKEAIDDNGLAMIFYRALSSFEDGELKVFGRLKQDSHFIAQLLDLYKELKKSKMTIFDLESSLESPEKEEDLLKIFATVESIISQGNYETQTKLSLFTDSIASGHLDQELQNLVLVIDGFTRFSAEEEAMIAALHEKCADIIIGSYISQKAYRSGYSTGTVYQASLEFMTGLASQFQTKPLFVQSSQPAKEAFSKLSQLFEAKHDFSQSDLVLTEEDKKHFEIWDVINQKEEVEHLAKAIRHKLYQGYRYKDILVLLGDVDSYSLQISKIFDKYDIPYYFGKAESMSAHPLVHFIDSLERVKRYRFRKEDVMNLLKTGLYGSFKQDDIDLFEQYLTYADIKGQAKFFKPFTIAYKGQKHLDKMNALRAQMMAPLQELFKARKQLGANLLNKWIDFLGAIGLTDNFNRLTASFSEIELEKQEQVWKTFTGILEQFQVIFSHEKLSLDELLSLLRTAILSANYRMVAASLDVVTVKSYDLVEPHTNKFVYALGMTQSHFPKIAQNRSLISDDERLAINNREDFEKRLDLVSEENIKKNHFVALSLYNAASEQLVLSLPRIANDDEDTTSSYLSELLSFGIPLVEKGKNQGHYSPEDIGNYKALLSRVIEINRSAIEQEREMTKEEQTFWSVAVRYLRQKLANQGLVIPQINEGMETKPVAQEVMAIRFPEDKPLSLSSSGLTTFYNNQYKYFLQYVLGLQEVETIQPDARNHGTYLHRVMELLMQDKSDQSFDDKLSKAISTSHQENTFSLTYQDREESRYSLDVLDDIARSTASILRRHEEIEVESQEERFELILDNAVRINGIIDRIDRLSDGSLGVVDYKSSHNTFDIQNFYNGLSPQLITYLQALSDREGSLRSDKVFGAMYLHMQEPKTELKSLKNLEKLQETAHKELSYKGLFLDDEKAYLADGKYHLNDSLYSQEELDTLLSYNQFLFKQAAKQIRQGHFLINPYSEDGKTVKGDQLKAITGFEADRHMGYARLLDRLPRKEKRQGFLSLMQAKQEGVNNDL